MPNLSHLQPLSGLYRRPIPATANLRYGPVDATTSYLHRLLTPESFTRYQPITGSSMVGGELVNWPRMSGLHALGEVERKLYTTGDPRFMPADESPRRRLARAIEEASGEPRPYRSETYHGAKMLRDRYGRKKLKPYPGAEGPRAIGGTGIGFVPPATSKPVHRQIGYDTLVNHEMAHAYNQMKKLPQMRGLLEKTAPYRMTQQFPHAALPIGDLLFASEKYAREQGRPVGSALDIADPALQHTVTLPGGKQQDINWMRRRAAEHGYYGGRPIDDLIFRDPMGRQWFKQMVEGHQQKQAVLARDVQRRRALQAANR